MNRFDKFYFAYFLLHIPITVFMDSNIVVPKEYLVSWAQAVLDFHISTNKDFLLVETPLWLQVFGLFELVFQLPLFVYCSIKLYKGNDRLHWIWMVIYGFNASFTTLVCLVYVYLTGDQYGLSFGERINLLGIYSPYLVIPLVMLIDYVKRIQSSLSVDLEKKAV